MDVLALVFAIPAVLAANVVYVLIVRFALSRFAKLRPWVLWPSWLVVATALIDIVVVATIGAVAARTLMGPAFWTVHLLVFLFGAPSLANVLILSRRAFWFRQWYATAAVCCLFGVFLLFFQVGVGSALFGPEGVGGPFSDG